MNYKLSCLYFRGALPYKSRLHLMKPTKTPPTKHQHASHFQVRLRCSNWSRFSHCTFVCERLIWTGNFPQVRTCAIKCYSFGIIGLVRRAKQLFGTSQLYKMMPLWSCCCHEKTFFGQNCWNFLKWSDSIELYILNIDKKNLKNNHCFSQLLKSFCVNLESSIRDEFCWDYSFGRKPIGLSALKQILFNSRWWLPDVRACKTVNDFN